VKARIAININGIGGKDIIHTSFQIIIKEVKTMNFGSKKSRKIISTVIIILLVLSMIVPIILSAIA
jgi:hypothetical protein